MMSPSTAHSNLLFTLYYHIEAFEESQSCSKSSASLQFELKVRGIGAGIAGIISAVLLVILNLSVPFSETGSSRKDYLLMS